VTQRILHLIPSLDRTGVATQMVLLAHKLPHDRFDVHVCALSRGGPLEAELAEAGVPTTVIGKRWRLDPQAYWRLRRHVADLRPDVVHAWTGPANAYGYAAARACGLDRIVVAQRCLDPGKGPVEWAVDRHIGRHCSQVVVNSPTVRDFYVRLGVPAEKIRVIASAVDPVGPSDTTRGQLLAELDLPEGSRLVGVVGPLEMRKRLKDAIWAADLLKVIRDDVHLLLIGDGPHRDRLRRYRDQVVIRDKVHFLGHRSDVPRLLPHFDALWSTSGCEGQSSAILEAMAAGVPVVASDIPGTRDLVVPDETGYLVPLGDRAAVARYTNKLLDDADLAARLGRAAAARAREHFSVERMVEQYAALYEGLG